MIKIIIQATLNFKAVAKPNEDEINALTNLSVILQ